MLRGVVFSCRVSVHEQIKDDLVQLGKLQGFIAESKYEMERGKTEA